METHIFTSLYAAFALALYRQWDQSAVARPGVVDDQDPPAFA